MSHTADVAQGHQPHIGHEEKMEKGVAYIPPGEGARSLWVLGELLTYKIPSQHTGGAYSLFELTTQPSVGPPHHIQHREDESFYIIEGEYEFLIGEEIFRVGAGSLLYVPKGVLHSHKNVGKSVGRMLVSQTPGGLYENFFEEVGKPLNGEAEPLDFEDQPDAKRIVKVAAEYGIEIPAPISS
jgi:mannose-6-phosphate isomerase-like protein (cupin superfamily)